MKDTNGIFVRQEYGCVRITLKQVMEQKGITRNRLSEMTGIRYDVITRHFNNIPQRVDLDMFARICYVLDCKIEDLLHYDKPELEGETPIDN